jgi:hypothetical protein
MMKNKQIFLSLLLIVSSFLASTGCLRESSEDVNQDKIHTEYELYYDANADKTYARAVFKFGSIIGTLLELSGSSQVTCNGQVLTFKQALSYYEREYPGFVQSGTFVWTDTEGNSFTNTVSINPIGYPSNLDTLSRNQSFELVWTGDSLANNQNVTLTVNGENETDLQIFFQDNLNSHSIILEKNKLQNLGAGPGKMYLDRRNMPPLQQKTSAGGLLTGRYRPENKNIILN